MVRPSNATAEERAEAAQRAESKIGHRAYSLLWNNCEHFVSWCATGVAGSQQVIEVARRVPGAAVMLAGPFLAWTGLVVLKTAFGRLAGVSGADPHAMARSRTPVRWRCTMGAGEVLPGRDPPDPGGGSARERAHARHPAVLAGRTVIRKEPLGPDAERRLRHELAMLERLRGVEGVAQLAEAPRYPGSIVLADAGGTSLAGLAKPLAVDDLIGLAVELARAVAGMHRRGVMHRDITPANIVVSGGGAPCLVDFALATSFAEIRPEFTHHAEIVGTLAYLAPEQTGRTGRPVDQRADLYALGATLYELATGGPPFGTGDPLRLTHDHLARVPVPPAEVNPAVPGPLSAIIMHLLEKEPDNRYQTADGVVYDLERLRDAGRARQRARCGSASMMFRCGCCRRRGWWAATRRWRRWRRRSRMRWRAGAGGCWSAARRGWARRRWPMSCGRW